LANNAAPIQPAAQSDNAARQAFARRYGLPAPSPAATASAIDPTTGLPVAAEVSESPEHGAVRSRLETIILDKVQFDGLPLGEVIKILVDQSASRDADKQGMNFMVNRETPPASSATIDPTTGLPVAPAEAPDLRVVTIKIDPPLKHIRLIDALDAITKSADQPIKYSIEDYGVLFSFDWARVGNSARQVAVAPPQFRVATYRVNATNDFVGGLKRAFHKSFNNQPVQPEQVSVALVLITEDLGAKNKLRIVYNDQTGVIMARGTEDDLQILEAVITTLGGSIANRPETTPTASNTASEAFARRYGIPSVSGKSDANNARQY